MYITSSGTRTLRGAERRLFVESLAVITDLLSTEDGDCLAGISIFDDLQRNQKLAVLSDVGKALLFENVAPPKLVAVGEAAVAAVYRHLDGHIAMEIERQTTSNGGDGIGEHRPTLPSWREMVLAAVEENVELEVTVSSDCVEEAEWNFLVECLLDRIVWDHDWEMEVTLDAAPEQTETMKEILGIDDEYYTWIPTDPSDQDADRILSDLHHWTAEVRN